MTIDKTKLEGSILARLAQAALWRAAHVKLQPLIERAKVTDAQRKAGLKPVPRGLTTRELAERENTSHERAEVACQDLVQAGKVVAYSIGGGNPTHYRSASDLPQVTPHETARIALILLADRRWPGEKIEGIVQALTKGVEAK